MASVTKNTKVDKMVVELVNKFYGADNLINIVDVFSVDEKPVLVSAHYDEQKIVKIEPSSHLRKVRGEILDISDPENIVVLCPSMGYISEVVCDDFEQFITDAKAGSVKDKEDYPVVLPPSYKHGFGGSWDTTALYEGTKIRVWYYKDKLMISTHRKIDISDAKSSWAGSRPFITMFKEACGSHYEDYILKFAKEGKVMNFILSNPDLLLGSKFEFNSAAQSLVIRLDSDYTNPKIAPKNGLLEAVKEHLVSPQMKAENAPGIMSTETFHGKPYFLNKQEASEHLASGEALIFAPTFEDGTKRVIKLVSSAYKKRYDLVSSDPSVQFGLMRMTGEAAFGNTDFFKKFDVPTEQREALSHEVAKATNKVSEVLKARQTWAMKHYIASLPSGKAAKALKFLPTAETAHSKLIAIMQKYQTQFIADDPVAELSKVGVISERSLKDKRTVKTVSYLSHRVKNAISFAKSNSKSPKQVSGNIQHNIMTGVMRDSGENVYAALRTFGLLEEETV